MKIQKKAWYDSWKANRASRFVQWPDYLWLGKKLRKRPLPMQHDQWCAWKETISSRHFHCVLHIAVTLLWRVVAISSHTKCDDSRKLLWLKVPTVAANIAEGCLVQLVFATAARSDFGAFLFHGFHLHPHMASSHDHTYITYSHIPSGGGGGVNLLVHLRTCSTLRSHV